MAVSKALRYQVLRRDQHTCRYCGRSAPEVKLTVDHVTPSTLGGRDEPENLVTACHDCNSGKAATPPDAALVANIAEDALRWASAREAASDLLKAERKRRDQPRKVFLAEWNDWTYTGSDGKKHTIELPTSWPTSIDQLVKAGLTTADLTDAVDIAMRTEKVKDTFKYFCGVAWGIARDLDDRTRELIDAGSEVFETTSATRSAQQPPSIDEIVQGMFGKPKPETPTDEDLLARLRDRWTRVFDRKLTTRCTLASLRAGSLVISTPNADWQLEIKLRGTQIVNWLNQEFRGAVTNIEVGCDSSAVGPTVIARAEPQDASALDAESASTPLVKPPERPLLDLRRLRQARKELGWRPGVDELIDHVNRRSLIEELRARWPELVGEELAANTAPLRFNGDVLVIAAVTLAWRAKVVMQKPDLRQTLNAEACTGAVKGISVIVGEIAPVGAP